jgi:hypothetical protein
MRDDRLAELSEFLRIPSVSADPARAADVLLRDAFYRDYRRLLLSDCTSEPIGNDLARSNHEASQLVIETLFGWVADSCSLLRALEQDHARAAVAGRGFESQS